MRRFATDEQLRMALSLVDRLSPDPTPIQRLGRLTLAQLGELERARLIHREGGPGEILTSSFRLTRTGRRMLETLSAEPPLWSTSMATLIDPHRFTGKRLFISPDVEADVPVTIDGLRVGWIRQERQNGEPPAFVWAMTGPDVVNAGRRSGGEQPSLEAATAAFQQAFDRWRAWALDQGRPVVWFE